MTKHQEMIKNLKSKTQIVFGPIIGSLELETTIWAGFIRKYKIDNPDKEIIVLTRSSRRDLYYGCVDDILEFDIPYEGEKFVASGHTLTLIGETSLQTISTEEIEKYLLAPALKKYPNAHFENLTKIHSRDAFFFGIDGVNSYFTPYSENFDEVHKIIKTSIHPCWVVIDPFNEINNEFAQWDHVKWTVFFKHLSLLKATIFFPDPELLTEIPDKKNFANIFEMSKNYRCTYIGTMIETIRISDMVFGTGGVPKVLAEFANIPYLGFKFDSNPLNVLNQIESVINNNFKLTTIEEITEKNDKLIHTNFSNNHGSNHPNNPTRLDSKPRGKGPRSKIFTR